MFEVGDRVEIIKAPNEEFMDSWNGTQGRVREDVPGVFNFAPEKFVAIQPIGERPDGEGSSPFYWPKNELTIINEKESTMTFATDANDTLTLWAAEVDRKIAQYEAGAYDYRTATAVATLRNWKDQIQRAQDLLVENAPELRPDPFVVEVNDVLDGFDAGIEEALAELTETFAGDIRLTTVAQKAAAWRAEIAAARALVG